MQVTDIAKIAHELNKAYCESIGDNSQPDWEDAPDWQKKSAINGVEFHLNNPNATPSASHESWLKQKTEEGWKYGKVKNPEMKEHPCFVPYSELPTEQKAKDYIFRQTIHSLKLFLESDIVKEEPQTNRELTFGEQLVGLSFNPSGDAKVQRAKELCAELADLLNNSLSTKKPSWLDELLFNHAVGEILNAQMNVVKVLTFKY